MIELGGPRSGRYLSWVLWLALSSCGTDSAGGPAGTGSAEDIDSLIDATCDWARTCCQRAGLPPEPLVDCEAQSEAQNDLYGAIRSGKAQLLEPEYSECVAAVRSIASTCQLGGVMTDACTHFFRGTIAPGGACNDAVECASTTEPVVCLRAGSLNDDQPGVCRVMRRASAGEPCIVTTNERSYGTSYGTNRSEAQLGLAYCDQGDGLYCSFPEDVCKVAVGEGGACDGLQCAPGLYCDDIACQRTKELGEACTSSSECIGNGFICTDGACARVTVQDTELCEGDFD